MTPEMKEKCLNPDMRAFLKMDLAVQEEIRRALPEGDVEYLRIDDCSWGRLANRTAPMYPKPGYTYRIRPDYPTERGYDEYSIFIKGAYWMYELAPGFSLNTVHDGTGRTNFAGIVYNDGGRGESVYYYLSPAFGTPLRIRFWKD